MDFIASMNVGLAFLAALLAAMGGYGLWLGRVLRRLERKLERLQQHCQACRREVAAQLAGCLLHDPERTALWEALHYHDHPPRESSPDGVRISGD
jgi:hypothetical protein